MKRLLIFILVAHIGLLAGCFQNEDAGGGASNEVDYSIIQAEENVPEEMKEIIDQNMEKGGSHVVAGEDAQFVFIGLGERRTGGYGIHISSVEVVDENILIVYNETKPSEGSMTIQAITYPYVVLKVDSMLPIKAAAGEPIVQEAEE